MLPQVFSSSSGPAIPGYPPMQSTFSLGTAQQFATHQAFLPGDSLHQGGTDPNSPELFKQNLHLAQDHVVRIQTLARSALAGIQRAYHPGNSPTQEQANITALKQALQEFDTFMLQTGTGALPMLALPGSTSHVTPQTEQELMDNANEAIQTLYEQLKRRQDSASVVANLLGLSDHATRTGK